MTKQMNLRTTMTLAVITLGFGLFEGPLLAIAAENQPTYESSIKVKNQAGEQGEAINLFALAKIDASRAMSAALEKVPGTVFRVSLDNENGNLVFSVGIKMANNEIRDVKVDAGNAMVLSEDTGGGEQETGSDGDSEDN